MTDLPAIKYLDMAAKAANCVDWDDAKNDASGIAIDSIIAHARTLEALAKYEPEPVDEDEAALVRILNALYESEVAELGTYVGNTKAALAQYKAERLQFALAVVKRDPAALEAFRGVA